ncbi:MAG: hypothetical protein C0622_04430 [Desulfuromonas sp.]|nr:MAG: hypothetical protein C0622_04430 [Desulfuromonas sp.]
MVKGLFRSRLGIGCFILFVLALPLAATAASGDPAVAVNEAPAAVVEAPAANPAVAASPAPAAEQPVTPSTPTAVTPEEPAVKSDVAAPAAPAAVTADPIPAAVAAESETAASATVDPLAIFTADTPVPRLIAPMEWILTIDPAGAASGENVFQHKNGAILSKLNVAIDGGNAWLLTQFAIETPHDLLTGKLINPQHLPARFVPVGKEVITATAQEVLDVCRAASEGVAEFPVPVKISATLTPNSAALEGTTMTESQQAQLAGLDGRVVEAEGDIFYRLRCAVPAAVRPIYTESCPEGFVLEGTDQQLIQYELTEGSSARDIPRGRCVPAPPPEPAVPPSQP